MLNFRCPAYKKTFHWTNNKSEKGKCLIMNSNSKHHLHFKLKPNIVRSSRAPRIKILFNKEISSLFPDYGQIYSFNQLIGRKLSVDFFSLTEYSYY